MIDLVEFTNTHCLQPVTIEGGVFVGALFVTGLAGSVSHCVGMCGPLVLAQAGEQLRGLPLGPGAGFRRLRGAALLPYQLGRGTTYAALGALAASFARGMQQVTGFRWVAAGLLLLAAVILISRALPHLPALSWAHRHAGSGWWGRAVSSLAQPLFARPTGLRGYLLGMALGFLPCGLLYGAIAAVAATQNPTTAALGMAAFTGGTFPALFGLAASGGFLLRRWPVAIRRATTVLLLGNAAVLTGAAASWLR